MEDVVLSGCGLTVWSEVERGWREGGDEMRVFHIPTYLLIGFT